MNEHSRLTACKPLVLMAGTNKSVEQPPTQYSADTKYTSEESNGCSTYLPVHKPTCYRGNLMFWNFREGVLEGSMQSCGAVDSGECWGYQMNSRVKNTWGTAASGWWRGNLQAQDIGRKDREVQWDSETFDKEGTVSSSVAVDPWCEGRSTLIAHSPCIAFEITPVSKLRLDMIGLNLNGCSNMIVGTNLNSDISQNPWIIPYHAHIRASNTLPRVAGVWQQLWQ